MDCPKCQKEVMADSFFCAWCSTFIPSPAKGNKANLFARWIALMVDPLIAIFLYLIIITPCGLCHSSKFLSFRLVRNRLFAFP